MVTLDLGPALAAGSKAAGVPSVRALPTGERSQTDWREGTQDGAG